jgi:proteasome lid subunit RPN8/RPN11
MPENDYQFAVELFTEDGKALGQAAVEVDWEPAREWAKFAAVRRTGSPVIEAGAISPIQPLWQNDAGEPYLRGFRICVTVNGGTEVAAHFPVAYFRALAVQTSRHFVERGILKSGEHFQYRAAAFPAANGRRREETDALFTVEEVAQPLPLTDASLESFLRMSLPAGEIEEGDIPVFVPREVLDEAAEASRQSGAQETGGVLIGHLRRDAGLPEVLAEVTAQLPARHTVAGLTKLTFTSETWAEARATLALRRKGELMLGWWHSHPVRDWCTECPIERKRACHVARDFFSEHDHALHRAIFPAAYSVGLVVNDVGPEDLSFSLFGWRRGLLQPRGFRILRGPAQPARKETETNATTAERG